MLFGLPTLFCSCIVGTDVSITNKTKTEKSIHASYPAHAPSPIFRKDKRSDSLQGYDISETEHAITSRDYYRYPVRIPIECSDTSARTFSFTLKPGHKVFLMNQYPSASPAFGSVFIIDKRDTLVLEKKGRFFKKRPKRGKGGSWTYIIKDGL